MNTPAILNKPLLAVLLFAVSIVGLSLGATLPLVALRLLENGASALQIGILSAVPAAGMILAATLVDRACQLMSRRRLYLLCFVLCTASTLAIEFSSHSLWALAAARLALGVGMGIAIILGEAWVNELCGEKNRGTIVALYATSFTAFQLLGPTLVALLGAQTPWVVLLVSAGHLVALATVAFAMPEEGLHEHVEEPRSFSLAGFLRVAPALCMGVLFFSFFDSVVLSLFPVYASSHGYAVGIAAFMATVILLGDMLFQLPLGWLSDRLDRSSLHLLCGVGAMLIGLALPWLISQPSLLWPALMVLGAVAGGVYTLALVLIGQRFRGRDLVTANAAAGMLWGVGSLLGPLLSGSLMDLGPQGVPVALALAAGLFVATAAASLRRTAVSAA
ncbi:MFS transporter [Pseudomonas nicosulfuronedens]|uniref:MFS transporter n=1 Tax=Pseudomonas nicosulfuronedens TaxID=2571105 RepID=A0A5R9R8Q8_9PSED|nr:MFS transporter [Pseudomonas nicosulfuronedens]MDH1010929.1 MFS transporter [Pseudomonas nicosulfuronedens]MDH1979452.1 MFS transporter [Pseudomonas nicosulfuronedens]MDH2026699.1 MFS transporter [Pseudomonas nicosulfuronedens]TLX79412.1 MFS transporter [Pseudomonas nicosulfuronedens]